MIIRRRRFRPALLAGLASTAFVASCMANPGEAPTVADEPKPQNQPNNGEDADEKLREINIGIDDFAEGFNPHLISDMSPLTDLVASLVLPSAFIPDPTDPASLIQDTDVLEKVSADVETVDGVKNTVISYTIRNGAQWSDGTPISGEDFRYLHAKMLETPGVAHSAGYEQIDHIDVSDGGRFVQVHFDGQIVGWRELFRNLLPSHLLKASTGSFESLLASSIPASGGRYSVERIDVGRNEVRIVRNDRFWGEHPATTEAIVLRPAGKDVTGAQQLRSDQLQAVFIRPEQTTALTYGIVPDTQSEEFDAPRTLSASLNVSSPRLEDVAVRRALLDHIDVGQVASVATGRSHSGVGGDGQASPTSTSTKPVHGENSVGGVGAGGVLAEFSNDSPLRIGAMSKDPIVQAAAFAVADQLSAAGVASQVVTSSASDLTRSLLPYGEVDMVVSWGETVQTRLQARDRYSCPDTSRPSLKPKASLAELAGGGASSSQKTSSSETSPSSKATSSETSSAAPTASETAASEAAAATSTARAGNLSGLCSPDIDQLLADPGTEIPGELQALVGQHAIEAPIVSDHVLTVVGRGVSLPDKPRFQLWPESRWTGRMMSIPSWKKVVVEESKKAS